MTTHFTGNPIQVLRSVGRKSILLVLSASILFAFAPSVRPDPAARLEKHSKKVEKRLARMHTGTLVRVDLRDSGEALGSLGELSDSTFQIVSVDSNKLLTFHYAEVASVKRGKEYIGAGSESGHHVRRWVPFVAGALVAGGGIAAYETLR